MLGSGNYYDVMRHWLLIDGKPTKDFGVYLSGDGTFKAAEKNLEEFTIPGRNGTFHYKSDSYKNVIVPYDCFIFKDFKRNVAALRSFLLSREGYVRIEDTHHPDEFRMGIYHEEFDPEVFVDLTAAEFTLNFDCKPERWFKSGEKAKTFTSSGTLINKTYFTAKPLIRCYGSSGTVTVNGVSVTVTGVDSYVDLDCEEQESHKGTDYTPNSRTTLVNGKYPELKPGTNTISFTGFTRVDITPRWWSL